MPAPLTWRRTNAPVASSRTDDIWFLDPQVGWAVNSNGHILKTADGGATWARQFAAGAYLRCVGFAGAEVGWVGTLTPSRRLFHTRDGGATWAQVAGLPPEAPLRICGLSVVNARVVYAAGSNLPTDPPRMMKTVDGGATWTAWDMRPHASILIDTHFTDELTGWVVGGKTSDPAPSDRGEIRPVVLFTEDGGRTWVDRLAGREAEFPFGEWGWKIQFLDDRVGFVSLENFADAAILKTADGGRTWERIAVADPRGNANLEGVGFVDESRGWVGGWGDADFESGSSSATEDGGRTWRGADEIGKFLNRFRFFGNPVEVGYASGDTVYKYSAEPVPRPSAAAPSGEAGPAARRRLLPEPLLRSDRLPVAIPVAIPEGAGRVTVEIWDRFGRAMGSVFDESRPAAGPRRVLWDGRDADARPAPDGGYIVRVSADADAESSILTLRARPRRGRGRSIRWVRHRVGLTGRSPIRALTSAAATPAASGLIDLPDLSGFPTPIEKARFLLHTAAEVEHALLVQYLYAAYSLKRPTDGANPAEQAALERWKDLLRGVSHEEMGHLMTVQNLLLLVRQPLNFEREDFPQPPGLYPFKLRLEPLTRRSLAKYVVAESPVDASGIDDIIAEATQGAGLAPNRVGTLYALIGVVFSRAEDLAADPGDDDWATILREVAALAGTADDPAAWHLPDGAFDAASVARQARDEDWSPSGAVRVFRVGDRAAALAALRDISVQGEGPTQPADDAEGSHFQRFLAAYRGGGGVVPFPDAEWVPARGVPTDPVPGGPDGDPASIVEPRARDFARLADLRYALLLGLLEQTFLTEPDARGFLARWCFDEMRSLQLLSTTLTGLPRAGVAGQVAALPFTLPAVLHLPESAPEQWQAHVDRFAEAIALVDQMLQAHSPGNSMLTNMKAADEAKRARADQARQGVLPPAPGRWEQVRRLLDAATGVGRLPSHGRFWDMPLADFVDAEVMALRLIEPPGPDRGRNSNLIKALKGEPPFGEFEDFPRMPDKRRPMSPDNIAFIERWIDDGCPEI